jgi:hypothetical protein
MSVRPRIIHTASAAAPKSAIVASRPTSLLASSRIVNASRNTASTSPTTLIARAGAGASAIAVVAAILSNYPADGAF